MIEEFQLLDLISQLYAAIGEPEGWTEFLESLCAVFDAQMAVLFTSNAAANSIGFLAGVRVLPPDAPDDGKDGSNGGLPNRPVRRISDSIVVTGASAGSAQMPGTGHPYGAWLRPDGEYHSLCVVSRRDIDVSTLSLLRPRAAGAFSKRARSVFRALGDHLGRALVLQTERGAVIGLKQAIDLQPAGVVMVDARANVIHANRVATDLCAEEDGLLLSDGRLSAMRKSVDADLRRLVAQTAAGHRGRRPDDAVLFVPRPSGRRPFAVIATAASNHGLAVSTGAAAAILFINAADTAPSICRRWARRLYSLTGREAELAALLVGGASVAEASRQMSVSISTARTHLRNLLRKTDTRSQAQLVSSLLHSLPPPLGD